MYYKTIRRDSRATCKRTRHYQHSRQGFLARSYRPGRRTAWSKPFGLHAGSRLPSSRRYIAGPDLFLTRPERFCCLPIAFRQPTTAHGPIAPHTKSAGPVGYVSMIKGPHPLSSLSKLEDFNSGEPSLDDWIKRRALRNQTNGSSRTYVISENNAVIGFSCLSAGAIGHSEAPSSMKRNRPDPIPVLVLGRLAIHKDTNSGVWERHSCGTR